MSRLKVIANSSLLPDQVNLEIWPSVDEMSLSEAQRETYIKRKEAVLMYSLGRMTQKDIQDQTGITSRN
ncbi:hypothetical protein [Cohnella terricola]|uniref:Uncharacterized protein n=1 Tax=Cohnella terricola TaxID=1289167 RepID=A0A559JQK9_9BACL|nr:hypothetical protein [Cohnella terricola]TVY02165.1 hypothetical protein FPZ45_06905 [Cohnella terricola]